MPVSRTRENIPPLPQYVFMAWYLIKHRDNFTFHFTFTVLEISEVRAEVCFKCHILSIYTFFTNKIFT
jgi:hypothetical protein